MSKKPFSKIKNPSDDPNYLFEALELIEWLKGKSREAIKEKTFKITLSLDDCLDLIRNLEKIFELEKELKTFRGLAELLGGLIKEAHRIYAEPGDQKERLLEIAKLLGMRDDSRKRKSRINGRVFYWEYLSLLSQFDPMTFEEKEPISKTEAQEILRKKYDLASTEAVRSHLNRIKKRIKKNREQEDLSKIFNFKKNKKIDK
jgi:hypothetical protein